MDRGDLDARLLAAHAAGDGRALARLYAEAGRGAEDEDAAGFYMTQAYVFALEAGLASLSSDLKAWLVAHGRETEA